MQDWIADYRVTRALDDPLLPGRRFVAIAPERLGLGAAQVVIEIGPGDPADLLPDLSRWAAAAAGTGAAKAGGAGLAVPLEVGPIAWDAVERPPSAPAHPLLWVSRLVEVEGAGTQSPVVVTAGAASGLAALHRAGGIHGAVSAGRILSTPTGGILDLPPPTGPSTPGLLARVTDIGILDGIAPELARGEPAGAPSDVWAIGAHLHLATTGQRVHPGIDGTTLLTAVQRAVFEPAQIVAGALAEVLAACCSFDPAERPSAAAVAASLAALGRSQ